MKCRNSFRIFYHRKIVAEKIIGKVKADGCFLRGIHLIKIGKTLRGIFRFEEPGGVRNNEILGRRPVYDLLGFDLPGAVFFFLDICDILLDHLRHGAFIDRDSFFFRFMLCFKDAFRFGSFFRRSIALSASAQKACCKYNRNC